LHIVSGGQTGVDRAALDVALQLGLPCGGWCPRGRRAEDGPISSRYPLTETESADYAQRTEWNVRDSDGTLILTHGRPTGGTALTVQLAETYGRPLHLVDFDRPASVSVAAVVEWLRVRRIGVLNVAGPRESSQPGIGIRAGEYLRNLASELLRSG